jgi:hypothetical protein
MCSDICFLLQVIGIDILMGCKGNVQTLYIFLVVFIILVLY